MFAILHNLIDVKVPSLLNSPYNTKPLLWAIVTTVLSSYYEQTKWSQVPTAILLDNWNKGIWNEDTFFRRVNPFKLSL